MREGIVSEKSSFSVWKVLGWMCLPLPYFIYQIILRMREHKQRETLNGKVVLITGASSGLGESLAHAFYTAGCRVVLASRRKDELERVRSDLLECYSTNPTHPPVVMPLDLTDVNGLQEKVAEILKIYGHIDVLVNNGGISVRSDALSLDISVDIKVMLVNYFGSVALTKAILPHMIQRREGRIVFVSSVQGKFAIPQRSAYAASKHALQAFADSLRAEVAEHNIGVTVVSPGYINTAMSINALTGSGASYGKMDAATSAGANPDDMAMEILRCVLRDAKDVVLAPITPRIAYFLRYLCPPLYFWIMARRALKLAAESNSKSQEVQ
ncbi:dehydrogenase/reductase SDR family protein 7-like [Lutzomyia longipalpis]|uniref:dehydrogenase/reductase SDR family protein 7-like n=1 Tax=Lutzomyia longipalpis TaxID=7200 RepID=UPI00248365A8|nr:dehydrogenase/reductase SDR family protein 7-like [Lutzomyia longipalpis]